jgi:hypothetical protein
VFYYSQIGEENYLSFIGGTYVGEVTGALNARFWLPYLDFFYQGLPVFWVTWLLEITIWNFEMKFEFKYQMMACTW